MTAHIRRSFDAARLRWFLYGPFGPSNFDKDPLAPRQNLELRIAPGLKAYITQVDECVLGYLRSHSERILKQEHTVDQVRDASHLTLKRPTIHRCSARRLTVPGAGFVGTGLRTRRSVMPPRTGAALGFVR